MQIPGDEWARRNECLRRYAGWERTRPSRLSPADAVAAVGALYELLPPGSRTRECDTSGVQRLHQALRHVAAAE